VHECFAADAMSVSVFCRQVHDHVGDDDPGETSYD